MPADGTDCGGGRPIGTLVVLPPSGDTVVAVVVDDTELVLVRPTLVAGGAMTDPFDTVTLLDVDEGGRSAKLMKSDHMSTSIHDKEIFVES